MFVSPKYDKTSDNLHRYYFDLKLPDDLFASLFVIENQRNWVTRIFWNYLFLKNLVRLSIFEAVLIGQRNGILNRNVI